MTPVDNELDEARSTVDRLRGAGDGSALAGALERLATAATEHGDLAQAAAALEEAAGLWDARGELPRQGHCLLLAASCQRLRGELGGARHDLDRAAAVPGLPQALHRVLEMEDAEQRLSGDHPQDAYDGFTRVLAALEEQPDPFMRARVLQRRAAAGMAAGRYRDAAGDLMDAEDVFARGGAHDEAEAAALGAAAAIANVEPETAERVLAAVNASPPRDGVAAAQRGIVGGEVAMRAGNPSLALRRFDAARRGALDAADPIAYLRAVSDAVGALETLGDHAAAYGRLATAWTTIGDLLGAEPGRQLVRPLLEEMRERIGADRFAEARATYERRRWR